MRIFGDGNEQIGFALPAAGSDENRGSICERRAVVLKLAREIGSALQREKDLFGYRHGIHGTNLLGVSGEIELMRNDLAEILLSGKIIHADGDAKMKLIPG